MRPDGSGERQPFCLWSPEFSCGKRHMESIEQAPFYLFFATLTGLLVMASTVTGQENNADLRNLARNPIGDVIKVPVTESFAFGAGTYGRTSNSLQVSPLIPLQMSRKWLLIPRIAASPVNYVADPLSSTDGVTGLGDTIATFFLTPAETSKLIWGIGLSVAIPTATNDIGGGKWNVGPSLALIVQPDWGSAGVVVGNIRSLPGNPARNPVHVLQIETSLSFNLRNEWYLFTSPTITADWTQSGKDRWLVPFGGGFGRTMNIAKQAVDLNVALYTHAVRPYSLFSPKWQIGLQCTLLYPRKKRPAPE